MRFRVLGAVEVWNSGGRVRIGGANRTKSLAVLLAEANHAVPIQRLMEALWDEEPPHTARRQVQNSIAAMRRTLAASGADPIERVGDAYRLTTDELDWLDFKREVARAHAASAEGRTDESARLLTGALGRWQGPALAGLSGDLIESVAKRIDEARRAATEHLVEAELELGRYEQAVDRVRALLTECPSRQRATGQLMRGLHLGGRQEEALQVYSDLRVRLADDLGLVPDSTLQRLYGRILRDEAVAPRRTASATARPDPPDGTATRDPAPEAHSSGTDSTDTDGISAIGPATAPTHLPADLPYFTGRSAALAELLSVARSADADRAAAVVAIDGMPGVGKTALAVHAAHRLAASYPDGQVFVDLRGYCDAARPLPVARALAALLGGLGVPAHRIPAAVEERIVLYRGLLDGRRVLVILDNAATADQVTPLLPGTAGSLVLTTGRTRPTRIAAARMLPLAPMPWRDAVELLARLVHDERITAAGPADLYAVVELCGRLPMAIRIAAARLQAHTSWSVGHLARRLREGRAALIGSALADCQMTAAIDQSYRRLPVAVRAAYLRLGSRLRRVDAETAAAATGSTVEDAQLVLDTLFESHLLDEPEPGRYVFHDLVRVHAARAAVREPVEARRRGPAPIGLLAQGERLNG